MALSSSPSVVFLSPQNITSDANLETSKAYKEVISDYCTATAHYAGVMTFHRWHQVCEISVQNLHMVHRNYYSPLAKQPFSKSTMVGLGGSQAYVLITVCGPTLKWQTLSFLGLASSTMATRLLANSRSMMQTSPPSAVGVKTHMISVPRSSVVLYLCMVTRWVLLVAIHKQYVTSLTLNQGYTRQYGSLLR